MIDLINASLSRILPYLTYATGLILSMHPANERRYFVTTSLIGWAQAWISPVVKSHVRDFVGNILNMSSACWKIDVIGRD